LVALLARLGSKEEAMLNALLSVGGWVLICALILFGAEMAKKEREFFSRGDGTSVHLD
jgi:hypothetical protein